MRHVFALLIASFVVGCASLDAGRIVVVSLVARLDRERPALPDATRTSRAGTVELVAALTRPSTRVPRPVEPPSLRGPPPARLACRAEALCAFEALAVREALVRIDRR